MKTLTLISIGTLGVAMSACSTAATPPADVMTMAGSGGTVGTAGAPSTTAGAPATTAGAGNTLTGGSGGSAADGGSGGTGGSNGTAGSSGAGGSGTSGAGGGTAGGGGSGGGTTDLLHIVGGWDGALMQYACGDKSGSGYDCPQSTNIGCKNVLGSNNPASQIPPSNGVPNTWQIAGTTGTVYDVTVNVRGVVEVTSYIGGTRDAGMTSILANGGLDLFQVGGDPQKNGDPSYDYNTYELRVTPSVNAAAKVSGGWDAYYLNAVKTTENPHAGGTPTTHHTYSINYTGHVKVPGGGSVKLVVTDSNCVEVMNCGPTSSGNVCTMHSSTSLAGTNPMAPASFVQPFTQPADTWGQWVFFDITNVTVAQ